MVSRRFLLIAVAIATVLLVTSEITAAKELSSKHESEVKDAKHDHYDDHGYDGDGPGGYDHDHGDYDHYKGRRHGHHHHHPHRHGGYYHDGGYCKYGCCGGRHYEDDGCRCCKTLVEATAYKQAH